MNASTGNNLQDKSNSEFITDIIRDANSGRKFVPFIGSGLSSPSGIIMGIEFTNYLAFTSYLVLSDPTKRSRTHGEGQLTHWDLQRQGWPPLPSGNEVDATRAWVKERFTEVCQRLELDTNYDDLGEGLIKSVVANRGRAPLDELLSALSQPPIPMILRSRHASNTEDRVKRFSKFLAGSNWATGSSLPKLPAHLATSGLSYEEYLIESGIRALADWRETLTFLACVRVSNTLPHRLLLDEIDNSIIDAFNTTITRDRRPNLGHKLVAHLSGPLRVSTILTTNFDTLTEDAYRALSLPLTVLPVSAKGDLPQLKTVTSADTLVKLHGEAHDTRADLTLDDEPSDADKATFSAYLTLGTGRTLQPAAYAPPQANRSNRLLVIGYSGSDYRCIQMMKHWLETASDDPRIYWICFSKGDLQKINTLFASSKFSCRIRATLASRPDLLLNELYQRLVLSLPPGGLTYEFTHVLPPLRKNKYDNPEELVRECLNDMRVAPDTQPSRQPRDYVNPQSLKRKRLVRDSIVRHIYDVIMAAANGKKNDDPKLDHIVHVADWKPIYRTRGVQSKHLVPLQRQLNIDLSSTQHASPDKQPQEQVVPIVITAACGVVRASAMALEDLSTKEYRKVFWLELQDYMDGDSILRDLLRTISLRFGQFQTRHVVMHPLLNGLPRKLDDSDANDDEDNDDIESTLFHDLSSTTLEEALEKSAPLRAKLRTLVRHLQAMLEEYRTDAKSLLVVLYGRDSYGNCSGIVSSTWDENSPAFFQLHVLIEALSLVGIHVIYFPMTPERRDRKSSMLRKFREAAQIVNVPKDGNISSTLQAEIDWCTQPLTEDHLDKVWHWRSDPYVNDMMNSRGAKRPGEELLEYTASDCSVLNEIVHSTLRNFYDVSSIDDEKYSLYPKQDVISRDHRQVEFLYALTLFRQSRHTNAICSEGVFPCPFRFESKAVDNDFVRAMESSRWIEKLQHSRLFFIKPGGAIWMHRDTRLAIQVAIEQTLLANRAPSLPAPVKQPQAEHGANTSGESGSSDLEKHKTTLARQNHSFLEMRGRMHFWIGEWYEKAFCSSGHLSPIIEAVHHLLMSAYYSQYAFPKRDLSEVGSNPMRFAIDESSIHFTEYRCMMFESAVKQATKILLLGWKWVELWQASKCKVGWLSEEHGKQVRKSLNTAIKSITGLDPATEPPRQDNDDSRYARLEHALTDFLEVMGALGRAVLLEGGGNNRRASARLDPESTALRLARDPRRSNTIPPSLGHGVKQIRANDTDFEANIKKALNYSFDTQPPAQEADSLWHHMNKIAEGRDPKRLVNFARWKAKFKASTKSSATLHDFIWTLGETAYLLLRRAKLQHHATGNIDNFRWLQSNICCNLGIDLCKHLPPWLSDYEIQSKIKMHSIYSVGLANLGRFYEANRHLNEAQALVSKWNPHNSKDHAVVALRRAEARLTECYWIRRFLDPSLTIKNRTLLEVKQPLDPDQTTLFLIPDLRYGAIHCWATDRLNRVRQEAKQSQSELATTIDLAQTIPPRVYECFRTTKPPGDVADVLQKPDGAGKWINDAQAALRKLYFSILDEAVSQLEIAEKNLGGVSQSNLWWSRLRTLNLRVYGLLEEVNDDAEKSLAFRKQSPDIAIFKNFLSAVQIAGEDKFRQLRALRYFLEANRWYWRFMGNGPATGDEDLSKYLPDSFAVAKNVYQSLKEELDKPNDDLLVRAIRRCGEQFKEVN